MIRETFHVYAATDFEPARTVRRLWACIGGTRTWVLVSEHDLVEGFIGAFGP